MNDERHPKILAALSFLLLAALLLAGCTAAEVQPIGPSTPPTQAQGSPSPDPTAVPGANGGAPGTVPGNPGGPVGTQPGFDVPVSTAPAPGDGGAPVEPQPTFVVPRPGRLGIHSVGAASLVASVEGRRVRVTLTWWSGVEPCAVLDSIGIEHGASTIALTIREGSDALGVACIEIAMLKATIVDLGELAPGSWTISAHGDVPPVRLTIH